MGDTYAVNEVTPKTIFRLEEEGRHQHATSREQYIESALGYQPYGRPVAQADATSKVLSLADGADFDGFLGSTVVDEDVKRNFEARSGSKALNAVFFDQAVTLFTGHGLISVGNGSETDTDKQLLHSSIVNTLTKGTPIKLVDGKFEEASAGDVIWFEYVEEVSTGVFRFRWLQNSYIMP